MSIKLEVKADRKEKDEMLEDGGTKTLKCSCCDRPIAVIWITRPNEAEEWKIKATCCYCGDSSFPETIKGGFHYKGYDLEKDGKFIPQTNIKDIKLDKKNEIVIIETELVK